MARSFGGDELTLTDVALKTGNMQWQSDYLLTDNIGITLQQAQAIYQQMVLDVEEGIDKMKTSAASVPVIMVGGGSALFPDNFEGVSQVVRPEHFEVANAIGVALGEISGQLDKIVPIESTSREKVLSTLEEQAKQFAIAAGACRENVSIIERSEIPLSYLQGNMVHVKIKAAGHIKMD
jgi:N-methylhydantoinase A/oxoprolinase/acetone carboxylase beta subunit